MMMWFRRMLRFRCPRTHPKPHARNPELLHRSAAIATGIRTTYFGLGAGETISGGGERMGGWVLVLIWRESKASGTEGEQ